MYEPRASADDMAMFGLTLDDIDDEVEVWPDNWPAFRLFNALGTQWRTGPGGATGLDYSVVREVAILIGLKKRQIPELFPDLQVMEAEALAVMAEA
ncbi:DUF1799 domain-containing protein [Pseudomonas sp. FP1740]|uniref:DUF1799 domain-containing protein n=1 Tax=Pseudomonas sp. FP1740 TaxID=2954078 RepID=UPI0027344DF2|nr:DUF1799 domain-containing protein [Pseudomonas sp. FP1740]WLG43228.1 DUF1799 domain-containing protein [Pseudomonas sp. FP1740]